MKVLLPALLLAALCACTSVTPPPPPSVETLDALTIVPSRDAPQTHFYTFAKGAGAGAAKGAAAYGGVTAGTFLVTSPACGPYAPICAAIGLIAATAEAAAGAVAGALQAVPERQSEEIESTIRDAVAKLDTQGTLASRVAALASLETRRDVRAGEAPAPGSRAVLELRVEDIGFETCGPEFQRAMTNACPYDPRKPVVALYLVAQARLARGSGESYLRTFRYASPRRPAAQWSADGGRLLAAEFELAYWDLAARVVDEVFLAPPFELPWTSTAWKLPGTPGHGVCWLEPLRPPIDPVLLSDTPSILLKRDPDVCAGAALRFPHVESLQPLLGWSAFPRELDRQKLPPGRLHSIGDVSYDLRIWEVENCERGRLVYERTGLPAPEHRVETPLAPGSRYYWSFRARFAAGERPTAMRWAHFDPVTCFPNDIADWQYHRFATPR